MTHKLTSPLGFADSTLVDCCRSGSSATVRLRTWNSALLRIDFRDVIGLQDLLAGDISEVVLDLPESSAFLREALRKSYEEIPAAHPYVVYSFLNNDDEPSLVVVAREHAITIEGADTTPVPASPARGGA